MEQHALYRAILAAPHDDTARLVYADWLDERAESPRDRARAELIRLQCQIARGTPAGWRRAQVPVPPELARRQQRLLFQHGRAWRRELPISLASAPFDRGFLRPLRAMRPTEFLLDPGTAPPVRGWPPGALADPLAVPPLWDVHLFASDYFWDPHADRGQYADELGRCAACPNLARVGWLKVSFFRTSTLDFFRLGRFDHVETLVLNCGPFPEVLDAVAGNESFRSLRYVELGGDEHGWCRTTTARERCERMRPKLAEMNARHLPFGEARSALRAVLDGLPACRRSSATPPTLTRPFVPFLEALPVTLPEQPKSSAGRTEPRPAGGRNYAGVILLVAFLVLALMLAGFGSMDSAVRRREGPKTGPALPEPVGEDVRPGPALRKPVPPHFVGPLRPEDR